MKTVKAFVILGHIAAIAFIVVVTIQNPPSSSEPEAYAFIAGLFVLEILTLLCLFRSNLSGDASYWSLWIEAKKARLRREINGAGK